MLLSAIFTVFNIFITTTMAQSTQVSLSYDKSLSASCNNFAKAFYKELSKASDENIVVSPFSVHMILSLLSHGAESETLNEFTDSLCHYAKDSLKSDYESLMSTLNEVEGIKLHIANAMYIQEGFELLTEFLDVGVCYKSKISKLNFKNKLNAATEINSWIKEKTNDKISNLVSSDDFDESMRLVIVNAIYFNGLWLHKFDKKNTQKKVFHVTGGGKKFVPTMFNKSKYDHGEISKFDAKFIEIPYMNRDVVMIIILPNKIDGLSNVQQNFSWEMLANATRSTNDVELYLPRFEIEFMVDLQNVLRKLGLNKMFEDNANFSHISDVPLKVSKVLHKAVIEVTEEGTEAAAATVVQIRLRRMISMPAQFIVDRPFMFVIEHKPTKTPLFIGTVNDIKVANEKDEL